MLLIYILQYDSTLGVKSTRLDIAVRSIILRVKFNKLAIFAWLSILGARFTCSESKTYLDLNILKVILANFKVLL